MTTLPSGDYTGRVPMRTALPEQIRGAKASSAEDLGGLFGIAEMSAEIWEQSRWQ